MGLDFIQKSQQFMKNSLDCVRKLAWRKASSAEVIDCEKVWNEVPHDDLKYIRAAERLNGYVALPSMTMVAVSGQSLFAWEQSRVTGTFPPMIPILLFVNIMTSMSALSLSIQVSDRISDLKKRASIEVDKKENSGPSTNIQSDHYMTIRTENPSKFEYLCLFTPITFTFLATASMLLCLFWLLFSTEVVRSGIVASALCVPVLLWTMFLKIRLVYLFDG